LEKYGWKSINKTSKPALKINCWKLIFTEGAHHTPLHPSLNVE